MRVIEQEQILKSSLLRGFGFRACGLKASEEPKKSKMSPIPHPRHCKRCLRPCGPNLVGAPLASIAILGGSWVVINGVISRVTILTTYIRGLLAPLITTHEPQYIRLVIFPRSRTVYLVHTLLYRGSQSSSSWAFEVLPRGPTSIKVPLLAETSRHGRKVCSLRPCPKCTTPYTS